MQALRAMATADYFVDRNAYPVRSAHLRHTPQRSSVVARLTARLLARRFDAQLASGVRAEAGSALDAHAKRLISLNERRQLAESLANITDPTIRLHAVPVSRARVLDAIAMIDETRMRLQRPTRVRPQGVARLRVLLGDAGAPFYRSGSGDLRMELRAVLAAM